VNDFALNPSCDRRPSFRLVYRFLQPNYPAGAYPVNTSVTETDRHLYLGSLVAAVLGRIEKEKIGL